MNKSDKTQTHIDFCCLSAKYESDFEDMHDVCEEEPLLPFLQNHSPNNDFWETGNAFNIKIKCIAKSKMV